MTVLFQTLIPCGSRAEILTGPSFGTLTEETSTERGEGGG